MSKSFLSANARAQRRHKAKRAALGFSQLNFWIHESDRDILASALKKYNADKLQTLERRMSLIIRVANDETEITLHESSEIQQMMFPENKPLPTKKTWWQKTKAWLGVN
jgi:hypothetical protein